MTSAPAWWDDASIPALLRAARRTYGNAIREELEASGLDDVPRNGSFVLGSMSRGDAQLSEIIAWLGVSKQSAGQLIDALVARGYIDRAVDVEDRRRLIVTLTDRGSAAAAAIRSAVDSVDTALVERLGTAKIESTREVLAALIETDHAAHEH